MSTSAVLRPMIRPDGTPTMVDGDHTQDAADAGYQPGLTMHRPNGDKTIVPIKNLGDAINAGYKTEGQYQQPSSGAPTSDDAPHGFLQSLVAPIPMAAKSIYHNFADAPRNADEARSVAVGPNNTLTAGQNNTQPTGAMKALSQVGLGLDRTLVQPTVQAVQNVKNDLSGANDNPDSVYTLHKTVVDNSGTNTGGGAGTTDPLATARQYVARGESALVDGLEGVPVLGGLVSASKQAAQQSAGGDDSGALGTILGNVLTAGMAGEFAKSGSPAGDPVISPEAQSARQITGAINPAPRAYPNVLEAIKDQTGNIMDHARATGQAVSGAGSKFAVPSFGELAKGLYQKMAGNYEDNVLGPNGDLTLTDVANKMRQLNPTAEVGPTSPQVGDLQGQNPTLRQIDQRIVDISNEQKSANRQPTPGQALGASDAELTAEKAHLSDLLHNNLGTMTGLGPDDIEGMRKQMAQLNLISGETQGGANATTRGANGQANGAGTFIGSPKSMILHTVEKMIPGLDPESVQGRRLINALRSSPLDTGGTSGANPPTVFPGATAPTYASPDVVSGIQGQAKQMASFLANDDSAQAQNQAMRTIDKIHSTGQNQVQASIEAQHAAQAAQQQAVISNAKNALAAQRRGMTLADYLKAKGLTPQ